MATASTKQAPAGQWTQFTLAEGVLSFRIQNNSLSVPIRMAVQAGAPAGEDGYVVIGPDPNGAMSTDAYDAEDGDSVWVRPHDHSGIAATVTVVPIPSAE